MSTPCTQCGAWLTDDEAFCRNCGARRSAPVTTAAGPAFCGNCGGPLNPGSSFCAKCGARVGAPAVPVPASAPSAVPPRPAAPAAFPAVQPPPAVPPPSSAAVAPPSPAAPVPATAWGSGGGAAAPPPPQPRKSGSLFLKIVLVVLGLIAVITVLGIGSCIYVGYRVKKRANQIQEAYKSGDVEKLAESLG